MNKYKIEGRQPVSLASKIIQKTKEKAVADSLRSQTSDFGRIEVLG